MKDSKGNNLPDFLIVGAPKCGTTSMYHYLDEFDDIFMSIPKEPKFITSQFLDLSFKGKGDCRKGKFIKDYDSYTKLFEIVTNQIAGEASADTLYYYKESIPKIKEIIGDPKILIFLRNPINRAFSAYMHLRRDLRETVPTFKEAISLENKRIEENYIFLWHYLNVGKYYEQVNAYLNEFSDVKIILFDDLKREPKKIIQEVRSFLGLEKKDFDFKVEKFNQSGSLKHPWLKKIYTKNNFLMKFISKLIPSNFKGKVRDRVFALEKATLKKEDKEFLQEYFKDDILNLQDLIKRDLTHWLKE